VRIDLYCYAAAYKTDRYAPGRHTTNIQPRTTQNFINHRPTSTCNSAGTEELPDDGTQVPKHVRATE
jgi:hypothetical protein